MLIVNKIISVLIVLVVVQGCAGGDLIEEEVFVYPPAPDEPRFYFQETVLHSGNVMLESEQDLISRLLVGKSRDFITFGKPGDIFVEKGKIYLSDTAQGRIIVFDRPGNNAYTISKLWPGTSLAKPFALRTDDSENLYVIDGELKQVIIFDADGNYVRSIGSADMFDRPSGLAVSRDGKTVFVSDTGGVSSRNHRIRVFDGISGEHLYDFGSRGTEPGQFNLPKNIKLDGNGQLYVNDSGNFRVQVLNAENGEFIRSVGSIGMSYGQFSRPKGIAIDKNNILYVSDALLGNVQLFNDKGQLLMFIGKRGSEFKPGNFLLPAGVAVDEDGRVYVVGQYLKKIDIFRPVHIGKYEGYFSFPDPDRTLKETVDEDKAEERLEEEFEVETEEVEESPSS